ncbi:CCDC130 [Lepeophtheirus salmonis]|uniref:CCDC130 n=1 Tax=Lepeophtheirus salmonis TaxID=72036 RepID=A0A7R8HAP0_LEPSM|nr:CCDC130 [Lepeophtheirus salmonis]CAF2973566.1 CCDC130 [Lepeophtheirus salmonis]
MGVRYNAEKKKIGMYYTTPVYQFRMKCHLCDNHFEIKTDPGNLDYVILSGARRQEKRWDPTQNGQVVPDDKDTIKKLYNDPMFKLEHGTEDKAKSIELAKPRIEALCRVQDRVKDDYLANRALRDEMRIARRAKKAQEGVDNALREKASINIELVPENDDDIKNGFAA